MMLRRTLLKASGLFLVGCGGGGGDPEPAPIEHLSAAHTGGVRFEALNTAHFEHDPVGFWTFTDPIGSDLRLEVRQRLDVVLDYGAVGYTKRLGVTVLLRLDGVVVSGSSRILDLALEPSGWDKRASIDTVLQYSGSAQQISLLNGVPATATHRYSLDVVLETIGEGGLLVQAPVGGWYESSTMNRGTEVQR